MKKEKQVRKSLAVPESLWRKLENNARIHHVSTSAYVKMILVKHLRGESD